MADQFSVGSPSPFYFYSFSRESNISFQNKKDEAKQIIIYDHVYFIPCKILFGSMGLNLVLLCWPIQLLTAANY
jgi:hypothetical protein